MKYALLVSLNKAGEAEVLLNPGCTAEQMELMAAAVLLAFRNVGMDLDEAVKLASAMQVEQLTDVAPPIVLKGNERVAYLEKERL